ncbi:MAG: M48 family metalloprotease [Gemmataceae bacterium]|nr:M48 family metalloprotease [Gemmataceae bacterium]
MEALLHVGLSNCLMALGLACVAAYVGRWCRRPAVSHGLWLLVLLKLVTPPLLLIPISWPASEPPPALEEAPAPVHVHPEAMAAAPTRQAASLPQAGRLADEPGPDQERPAIVGPPVGGLPADGADVAEGQRPEPAAQARAEAEPLLARRARGNAGDELPWWQLVGALWLAGSVCWFGVAGARIRAFRNLLNHAQAAPEELQTQAEELATRLGLRRCPQVWLVPGVLAPMLWAVGRAPRLLLPEDLLGRLDEAQRATLLAHELAHLRRRDHWVRMLELLVLGLYWWFPLVWWARRELREAEEECCDAWVVWALPEAPRTYATALVETLDFLAGARPALPPVASGIGQVTQLRRRLTMIMRGNTPRALTGAGVLGLLGLAAVLLPLVPSWAQDRPADGEEQQQREQQERREQLQKSRAELEKMAQELAKVREQLARQQAEVERKARELQEALERLRRDEAKDFKPYPKPDPRAKPMPTPRYPFGGRPGAPVDLGKRLDELERKLDTVLRELQDLRRDMGRGRPGQQPQPKGARGGGAGGSPGYPGGGGLPGLPGLPPGAAPGAPPTVPGVPAPPATPVPPRR